MRTPPLLLGAALLFWGWQTGHLFAAGLFALILEGSRLGKVQWSFGEEDFHRIWNFCSVLFIAAAVYAFATNEGPARLKELVQNASGADRVNALAGSARITRAFLQWLPFMFFSIVAAQAYSDQEFIAYRVFSLWLRYRASRPRMPTLGPPRGVHTAYPYLSLCLFSASATQAEGLGFRVGFAVIICWALWPHRSPRFSPVRWLLVLGLALGIGFYSSDRLYQLQRLADNASFQWLANWFQRGFDAKESRTMLGQVAHLKQSGKIIWRIEPLTPDGLPALLREATYHTFKSPVWHGAGSENDFQPLFAGPQETSWILLPATNHSRVRIAGQLPGGKGLLALPTGCNRLDNLLAFILSTNRLGSVRLDAGPSLAMYDAEFGPEGSMDSAPTAEDRQIPDTEKAAVESIITEYDLRQTASEETLGRVRGFFRQRFQYSLSLAPPPRGQTNRTPVEAFLQQTRAGHCEYFATATTLLLRALGMPARYATGYAVGEKHGRKYIVRARHAHAWCLVFVNGQWRNFDTTPSSWMDEENRQASIWEFFTDVWSRIAFEFSRFRWGFATWRQYLIWGTVPLLAIALAQLWRRKGWKRHSPRPSATVAATDRLGLDSEWYQLESRLAAAHWPRQPHETVTAWLGQLIATAPVGSRGDTLRMLRDLHYRLRFDPAGLDDPSRQILRDKARGF